MEKVGNILVIDDEKDVGEFITTAATALGLHCIAITDPSILRELLTQETTLILLDLMMPRMDGIEVLRLLGELHCKTNIVLMSGINQRVIETAEKLAHTLDLSIAGHLQKPFRLAELENVLLGHAPTVAASADKLLPGIEIDDRELRLAIEKNQFLLHYQPQVDIASGALLGFEALVRWLHPSRGLIFPDSFISRLESLGLIDDLCWLVVAGGLDDIKLFASESQPLPRLAVNISMDSLRNLMFPDKLLSILDRFGIPPQSIAVEITETGLIKEMSRTLDVLTRLRVKHFQLSIDDFGTGYAVMQQLRNLPATELKIDRTFVQNMLENASDRIMVQKIIEIGHELSMTVMAEGVENRQQLEFLREKGCDHAQGYYFSRPLPTGQLRQWIQAYRPQP